VKDPRLAEWRQKCLDGSITLDEYRQAIELLREGRHKAEIVKKVKRQKSTEKLLKELTGDKSDS
jgi:hypothetical protein